MRRRQAVLRLRLQYRLVACVVVLLGLCLAGSFAIARTVLLSNYEDIGNRHAHLQLERASATVKQVVDALHERSSEWGMWDDCHDYLSKPNTKFIDANLSPESIEAMKMDAVLLVNRAHKLVYGITRQHKDGSPSLDKNWLFTTLSLNVPGRWGLEGQGNCGLLESIAGPLAITIRPVKDSKAQGATTGWVVQGRLIDKTTLDKIGSGLGTELSWFQASSMQLPPDVKKVMSSSKSPAGKVKPISESKIAGYVWLNDIFERPIRLLRVVSPRTLYKAGVASLERFMRMIALITLLFGCVMVWMLNRSVVRRIVGLSENAAKIEREAKGFVPTIGKDEISALSQRINGMLASLYRSREIAEESQRQLNTVNAGLEHLVTQRTRDLNRANEVLQHALDGIGVFSPQGECLDANNALLLLLHTTEMQVIGLHWHAFVPYERRAEVDEALSELVAGNRREIETDIISLDGNPSQAQVTLIASYLADGQVESYHWFIRDISDRKQLENRIRHQAEHDALCGLPNRALFNRRVTEALRRRKRDEIAVLFVDLDNFKLVNDSLGHEEGDRLLKTVAERLKSCVREGDTVARMGGDEFTLLLQPVNEVEEAARIAQRIVDKLVEPVTLAGIEVFVSGSVGLALSTPASDTESLLRDADTAMYTAKQRGKSAFAIFAEEMQQDTLRRLEMESALRTALEHNQFRLLFQPLVDLNSGEVYGAETLVRWEHPELGFVSPDRFIPIAEETGVIVPIGEWILREACRTAAQWNAPSMGHGLVVAVNLSARQAMWDGLVPMVQSVLEDTGLLPAHLKLEITETLMMKNVEKSIRNLEEIRSMGVGIAIDDFGTGYSSLSYLQKLPVDTVKIDRSFIGELGTGSDGANIVPAIINLCRTMGLKVVGEGVETENQRDILHQLGCDYGQGYLFSKPISNADFEAYLDVQQSPALRKAA